LKDRAIETEVYYPTPLHQQPCFPGHGALPEAERASREVLALPVHPDLVDAQLDFVAESVRAFYAR
jgi:dTDP-4-amino-4,6-dideoxygalactose transaminase